MQQQLYALNMAPIEKETTALGPRQDGPRQEAPSAIPSSIITEVGLRTSCRDELYSLLACPFLSCLAIYLWVC